MLRTLTGKVTLGAAFVLGALIIALLGGATSALTLGALMQRVTAYTLTQRALSDDFDRSTRQALIEIQALMLGGKWDAQTETERALSDAGTILGELEAQVGSGVTSAELSADYEELNRQRRVLLRALESLYRDAQQVVTEGPEGISRIRPLMEAFDSVLADVDTLSNQVIVREQELVAQRTEAGVRQLLFVLGASLAGLLLVVVTAVVLLRRSIINPLLHLATAAHAFGKGELREPIRVTREDELGTLQGSFATMVDTIAEGQSVLQRQVVTAELARAEAEASQTALAAQLQIVAEQRELIREMSVPVLPVDEETLVMPLIGALDTARLTVIQQRALEAIERNRVRQLLIDVTGVPIIDTQVAQGLLQTIRAGQLLGASVMLIGVRPEVAQTLVALGIELSGIQVVRDLQGALRRG